MAIEIPNTKTAIGINLNKLFFHFIIAQLFSKVLSRWYIKN